MTNIAALIESNTKRWNSAKITRNFDAVAGRLVLAKPRYQAVSRLTGVPWAVIAVIHERECSQDWSRSLAQGDSWNRVSVHVPAGRGPFASWEDAAVDALVNCAPYAARNTDWSVGAMLSRLEEYNGLGYAARGLPSPYLWSGTDQYKSGKYVRDGVFDPDAIDSQLGCAGLLKAIAALDPSAAVEADAARPDVQLAEQRAVTPRSSRSSITNPSKGSIGALVASMFAAIFRRN